MMIESSESMSVMPTVKSSCAGGKKEEGRSQKSAVNTLHHDRPSPINPVRLRGGGRDGVGGSGAGRRGVFSYREDDDVCGVDLLPVGIAPRDCGDGEEGD